MWNKLIKRQAEIIENTDPDRIKVEDIRSFFCLPYKIAKFICDIAVKDGFLVKEGDYYKLND